MKRKLLSGLLLLACLVSCGGGSTTSMSDGTISNEASSLQTTYNVSFYDENGKLLETIKVNEGEVPTYNYVVQDTKQWDYTFEGWSTTIDGNVLSTLPVVSEDTSYYAVVSKELQKYTITFESNGGTTVDSITGNYGDIIDAPESPTQENYRFISWCYDESLKEKVEWPIELTDDLKLYAAWNEQINIKAYLKALVEGVQVNPSAYIPETMKPDYSDNSVAASDVEYDFNNFVDTKDIKYGGFGNQWNMVVDNIKQSQVFYNVLLGIETVISSSVLAFNNYFDSNPEDVANYSTTIGEYNVFIKFIDNTLYYVLEFANEEAFTSQILMRYDITTLEKVVRIQLSDANALKYVITPNSYSFAIRYLGVRRAYFEVNETENGVSGAIYEFLGIDGKVSVSSCAEFFVDDNYVSVVGNKAGGLIGFNGYINELYSVNNGKLLGYEVMETQTLLGVEVTFNTMWFNLSDVSGITSVKAIKSSQEESEEESLLNAHNIYINGSSTILETVKYGGINTKTMSRRFDIEMRTQYFYSYDNVKEEYIEHAVEIPMLFVQEEKLSDYSSDMKSANGITSSINVSNSIINKIQSDYDELIPTFIEHKELITAELILEYIGQKISF